MKKIIEEYGSLIIGVVGAVVILGVIIMSFMNDGLLANYINEMFNSAF